MAYNSQNLSVLAYANGFTLWHYTTTDTAGEADTSGYFNAAADMLRVGDMILANVNMEKNPGAAILLVDRIANGVVATTNLTVRPAAPAPLADDDLGELMRDPRYWRDQDPSYVGKVRAEFRRRYEAGE